MNDGRRGAGSGERLLDLEALGELLGKSLPALYQLRHRGQLPPAVKVGRSLRWRLADVEAWLEANREVPTEGVAS